MDEMDLLEEYIHYYIDSIKVVGGQVFATKLSFQQWKLEQHTEIRCVKNGSAIRFEIPPGQDPIKYAKSKLKAAFKKQPRMWEYQILEPSRK